MTLSADERAAIERQHRPIVWKDGVNRCGLCLMPWGEQGCDTEKMRAALVVAEERESLAIRAFAIAQEQRNEAEDERDAVEARAKALADALDNVMKTLGMMREHESRDHEACAYAALGVMNDGSYHALLAAHREQGARDQVERLGEAHDALGGMYSWNDAYLDDERNAHLWVTRAGRILREIVGRPARPPDPEP